MGLKKHPWAILVGIFLVTRLINLTLLPIFTDEANYLNWGWFELHGHPFYSLFDAKQPGLMWVFGLSEQIFGDPLLAGRIVAVGFGLLNLWGLWLIGNKLFGMKTAVLADAIYIVTPLFLFYDRQALMESSLICVSLFTFYELIKIYESQKIKPALLVGIILGLGLWIKSSALVFLVTSLGFFVIMAVLKKDLFFKFLTLLVYMLGAFLVVVAPLLLQSEFIQTWSRNSDYTLTVGQMLQFPWHTWWATLKVNLQIWGLFLTPVVLGAGVVGLCFLWKRSWQLIFWLFGPLAIFLFSAKFSGPLFQRYSTPYLAILVLPAALALGRLKPGFWSLLLIPLLISSLQIMNPPAYFQLMDRFTKYSYIQGYVTGQDTGYQVNEIVSFLKQKTSSGPITVALQLANFNPTAGVMDYARKLPKMTPYYIDTAVASADKIDCLSNSNPLYLVAVEDDLGQLKKFVQPVETIVNHLSREKNVIYTLRTGCTPEKTAPVDLVSMDQ